jgi:beta-barrel assembly-enhancing protease
MPASPDPSSREGWYFDGRTAHRHRAAIHLEADLNIVVLDDGGRHRWPYREIELLDELPDGTVRLALPQQEARLAVDAATYRLLAPLLPQLQPQYRRRAALRYAALTVVVLIGGGLLLWLGWPLAADGIARLIPESVARGIGQSALTELADGKRVCTASAGAAALQRLTERLAAGAPGQDFDVRVIDSADINAFAVPGGSIAILRGLLDKAGSPDEVAGVLGHEMGHVIERHPLRLLVRYAGLAAVGEMLLGSGNLASLGSLVIAMSYSRGFELEADGYGIDLLGAAGMDTGGLSKFFVTMEKKEHGGLTNVLRYLSSHPPTAERRERLAARAKPGAPAMSDADWQALRKICG